MIVALSMRVVENPTYPEPRDAISHDWIRLLTGCGATPVLVPNSLPQPSGYLSDLRAKGLILSGGEDIGPVPGESGAGKNPAPLRDQTEIALLQAALKAGIPVLGVCRGMQMINVHFGGTLSRDLKQGHAAGHHEIELVDPHFSRLAGRGRVTTNSYHNQGVTLSRLAPSLRPFAVAPHEIVEGLLHPDHPILGIQWHPERENPARDLDQALLQEWFARCG